jgi:hypothetical protein
MTKPIVIIDDSTQERAHLEEQVERLQEQIHVLTVRAQDSERNADLAEDAEKDLEEVQARLDKAVELLRAVLLVFGGQLDMPGVRKFLDEVGEDDE